MLLRLGKLDRQQLASRDIQTGTLYSTSRYFPYPFCLASVFFESLLYLACSSLRSRSKIRIFQQQLVTHIPRNCHSCKYNWRPRKPHYSALTATATTPPWHAGKKSLIQTHCICSTPPNGKIRCKHSTYNWIRTLGVKSVKFYQEKQRYRSKRF